MICVSYWSVTVNEYCLILITCGSSLLSFFVHFSCFDDHTILNFPVLLCIFPALLTGTHSKKQGEDLSDNDGDEDEGILFGDKRQVHVLDLFF